VGPNERVALRFCQLIRIGRQMSSSAAGVLFAAVVFADYLSLKWLGLAYCWRIDQWRLEQSRLSRVISFRPREELIVELAVGGKAVRDQSRNLLWSRHLSVPLCGSQSAAEVESSRPYWTGWAVGE